MSGFRFEPLEMPGAFLITSFISRDERGSFVKNFEKQEFADNGITFECSETFLTHSRKNVIRGMHFQLSHPQAKLIGVVSGSVYDVIVDLRGDSPTFGQWRGYTLSEDNTCGLYIPRGFAHGFLAQSEDSIVSYNCDGPYDKATDTGISVFDPDIAIAWPTVDRSDLIYSERDREHMSFQTFKNEYSFSMRELEQK